MPSSAQARHSRYSPSVAPPAPIQLEGDAAYNELKQIAEIEKCRADPVYFISNYCYIFETREEFTAGMKLFKLWPRQVECVRFIESAYKGFEREIVIEKNRSAGVSLLVVNLGVWHWLFDASFSMLMGTLNADKLKLMPGHDTLFAKIRDTLINLPAWLLPQNFDLDRHLTSMNLDNPVSGNTIRGELGTERFGRGPRASWVFRDESAFWNDDTTENTVHTAQLNIDGSTVNGLNFFDDLGNAAAAQGNKFEFDWWHNPDFTPDWYAKEEARARLKGPRYYAKFRQEVLRDKRAIVEGQIYPFIENCPRGDYEYNPNWPLFTIWDYGWADIGFLGFLQRDDDTGDLYMIDEVYNSQVSIEWYVPFVPGKFVPSSPYHYLPDTHLKQINEHKAWTGGPRYDYGDPSGKAKHETTGQSNWDILKPYGIKPICKSGWYNMGLRQEKTNSALHRLHIGNNCKYFFDSFTQFRVPKREENSQATTAQSKGIHKWSHAPSAFEAFAISEPPLDMARPSNTITFSNPWQARPTTFDRTA